MLLHPSVHRLPPLTVTLRSTNNKLAHMLTNKCRAGAGGFTYRPAFVNHLIKYVDENLVSDRLQAGRAVVSIRRAGEETV